MGLAPRSTVRVTTLSGGLCTFQYTWWGETRPALLQVSASFDL